MPTPSSSGKDSRPAQDPSGISATSAARARSETSISRRGPSTVAARPPHRPSSDMPRNSAASTAPIRVGECVDTITNQGSATAVISVPVVETTSAANSPASAVLTQRGDETRLGWYAHETRLTVASVAGGRFGRRAEFAVDGKVYAQPLYVPALTVGGTPHKLVIVATEHDSVYAFDADAGTGAAPLWPTSLLAPGARPMR